jgi:hypothetical protein
MSRGRKNESGGSRILELSFVFVEHAGRRPKFLRLTELRWAERKSPIHYYERGRLSCREMIYPKWVKAAKMTNDERPKPERN